MLTNTDSQTSPTNGIVNTFNQDSGFGTIQFADGREFFFSTQKLDLPPGVSLQAGQAVTATIDGDEVTSIQPVVAPTTDSEDIEGEIVKSPEDSYAFIRASDGKEYFVHASSFTPKRKRVPPLGEKVIFNVDQGPRGSRARNARLLEDVRSRGLRTWKDYVNTALIARSEKNFKAARDTYEEGMKRVPSPELVMAYASMEKGLGEYRRALTIFERGIALYPDSAKLYADAGHVALKLETNTALDLFLKGYSIPSISTGQKGTTAYHIATVYFDRRDYLNAHKYFLEAKKNRYSFSSTTSYHTSWIYTQIPFAKTFMEFLSNAGLRIVHIGIENPTHSVDFICEVSQEVFERSYGLKGRIFVRCFSIQDVQPKDVLTAIEAMRRESQRLNLIQDAMLIGVKNLGALKAHLVDLANSPNQGPTCAAIESGDLATTPIQAQVALRRRLDEWLYRRDLYNEKSPVTGSAFFGRDSVIKDIEGQINSGNHVGIFGLRKTGKTSLLYSLRNRLVQDLVVYLDPQRFGLSISQKDLRRAIVKELNDQLAKKFPGEPLLGETDSTHSMFSQIMAVRNRIKSRGILTRCVLLIDEVERLSPMPDADKNSDTGFEFFSALRGIAQQERGLISIVCGADPVLIEKGKWGKWDNPVFQFYHLIFMPMLDAHECTEMVENLGRGMGVTYTSEVLSQIFVETHGHPSITRGLCSKIVRDNKGRPLAVNRDMLDRAAQEYSFVEAALLKEIVERFRERPTEKILLELIYENGGEVPEADLNDFMKGHQNEWDALRRLLAFHLLIKQENKYRISMNLVTRSLTREGL